MRIFKVIFVPGHVSYMLYTPQEIEIFLVHWMRNLNLIWSIKNYIWYTLEYKRTEKEEGKLKRRIYILEIILLIKISHFNIKWGVYFQYSYINIEGF